MTTTTLTRPDTAVRSRPNRPGTAGHRRGRILHWIAVHSGAVALALFFVLPFVFVFLTSVMSDEQAMSGDLWPG
ncbi:sugar ABC transporter permease, partial [Streptomyces sp. FT05W]